MVTRTYTLSEYHNFIDRPENADRLFELIDGEIVEKMPSFTPSYIAGLIIYFLNAFVLPRQLGYVTSPDGGYILSEDKDVVLIPDVAFILKENLEKTPEREAEAPPDFAVEIKSPTDRKRALRRKAEKYLQYGTKLVWLVFPEDKIVEVYTPDDDVQTYGVDDTLTGGDVLPEFTLPVREIFPQPPA